VVRRIAADDADGESLGDVLGDGQQLRHRLERPAEVILIETGDDHAFAPVSQRVAGGGQVGVEKLPFVDPHDFGVLTDEADDCIRALHGLRGDPHVAVRHDVVVAEAVVDDRLEDLHPLTRDLRAAQPPDELLALPAEHAAGDDFDPATVALARLGELVIW
jgi:hypothetical protein